MEGRKQRSIKNYLVDKEIQMHVLAYGTLYMLLVVLVTISIMIFPLVQQMDWPSNNDASYYAAQTFITMTTKIFPAIAAIYVMYLVHLTILTHHICGPLVNFSHTFKSLGKGDLQRRVYLRHGDYLRKEMEQINSMIDELAGIIGTLSSEHNSLSEQLEKIILLRQEDRTRDITPDLEKLREAAVSMEKTLSFFQLGEK
jgi:methyl-accepting chemotaxis protein